MEEISKLETLILVKRGRNWGWTRTGKRRAGQESCRRGRGRAGGGEFLETLEREREERGGRRERGDIYSGERERREKGEGFETKKMMT